MDSETDNFRQESAKVYLIFMSDRRQVAFQAPFYLQRTQREAGKRKRGTKRDREEGQ